MEASKNNLVELLGFAMDRVADWCNDSGQEIPQLIFIAKRNKELRSLSWYTKQKDEIAMLKESISNNQKQRKTARKYQGQFISGA